MLRGTTHLSLTTSGTRQFAILIIWPWITSNDRRFAAKSFLIVWCIALLGFHHIFTVRLSSNLSIFYYSEGVIFTIEYWNYVKWSVTRISKFSFWGRKRLFHSIFNLHNIIKIIMIFYFSFRSVGYLMVLLDLQLLQPMIKVCYISQVNICAPPNISFDNHYMPSFLLSAGYDVYLGNFRGLVSREHVNKNISSRQ
jgi:hypothetical protein